MYKINVIDVETGDGIITDATVETELDVEVFLLGGTVLNDDERKDFRENLESEGTVEVTTRSKTLAKIDVTIEKA